MVKVLRVENVIGIGMYVAYNYVDVDDTTYIYEMNDFDTHPAADEDDVLKGANQCVFIKKNATFIERFSFDDIYKKKV